MKKYKEQPMSVRTAAILLSIAVLCMLMGNIGASLHIFTGNPVRLSFLFWNLHRRKERG